MSKRPDVKPRVDRTIKGLAAPKPTAPSRFGDAGKELPALAVIIPDPPPGPPYEPATPATPSKRFDADGRELDTNGRRLDRNTEPA